MLSDRSLHVITRSWPLWGWRYPWAIFSDLNPNTSGNYRLFNSQTTLAASIPQRQPLPVTRFYKYPSWWPPNWPRTQYTTNWQRKFIWPLETIAGLWLVSQWDSLSSIQKLSWDANWLWPSAGMDFFMWTNAMRVEIYGTGSLLTAPPPSGWLPLISVPTVTSHLALSDPPNPDEWWVKCNHIGLATFNSGNDFNPSTSDDRIYTLYNYARRCVDYWDPDYEVWYYYRRRRLNCRFQVDIGPYEAQPQFVQPQSVPLNFTQYFYIDIPMEVGFQSHVFLRDGRHGCTEWYFSRPGLPPPVP